MKLSTCVLTVEAQVLLKLIKTAVGITAGHVMVMDSIHLRISTGVTNAKQTIRTPTWDEMCQVKALFWEDSDCVVQYHPAKKDYVNIHNHCLHLWRTDGIPTPPTFMV